MGGGGVQTPRTLPHDPPLHCLSLSDNNNKNNKNNFIGKNSFYRQYRPQHAKLFEVLVRCMQIHDCAHA